MVVSRPRHRAAGHARYFAARKSWPSTRNPQRDLIVIPDETLASRYPRRATTWQLRTRAINLPPQPRLMGIVNVTPDSFSDGGKFFERRAAVDRALELAAAGADIVDIGGESTRPYATPVSCEEELRRVLPVVEAVCAQSNVLVSIDTSKARVAAAALAAGAEIINDVTGLEGDPEMVRTATESGAGVCVMHMQGTPQTMQNNPVYNDVVEEIFQYLERRCAALVAAGLQPPRICVDPGIGFGKTHQHNLLLLARSQRFHQLGQPLLVGPSRKRFIAKVLSEEYPDRSAGTIGVALALARQGVQILRVHDVRPVREALQLYAATGGIDGQMRLPE